MHALLTKENMISSPITVKNAGLVIREDGSFHVFNTWPSAEHENPLYKQQAETIFCLALAMQVPQIMQVLRNMANDREIVGDGLNLGALN